MGQRPGEPDLPARRGGGPDLSRPRPPRRLEGLVDAHAHLQHDRFDGDREAVIERATEAGIVRILVPGWDLASSEAALELAGRHAPLIHAAVGIHPHDASTMDEAGWARLEALLDDPRTAAVGETGLDYHRNLSPPETQRDAFGRQLALAAARHLPVVVHDREAHRDVADALSGWTGRAGHGARGMLHAFSGDAEMAARLTAAGFLLSFALPVAFRSASGPRAAAPALPDGSFLVETDSPYLGPDAAGRNEPTTVLRVASELAALRGTRAEALVAPMRTAYELLVAPTGG